MIKKIFIFSLILVFSFSWSEFQFVHSAKWVKHNLQYSSQLKSHITKHIYSKLFLKTNFEIQPRLFQNLFLNSIQDIERFSLTKLYILYCELKFE